MMRTGGSWRALAVAVAVVAAIGFAGPTASAEPVLPPSPNPVPPSAAPPVTQPLTVAPGPVSNVIPATAPTAIPSELGPANPPGISAVAASAASGTLRDYFASKSVKLEPQQQQGFKALDITLPVPPRWTPVPDPNVLDPFAVIANRFCNSLYTSNAQVVVYKLIGDFNSHEAISHGYIDSQQLPAWQTTNASLTDFAGFPSSIIEGTYRQNDMTLNTSRRHVIATSGRDRYLVSLAVTTDAARAVAEAPATDAIVNGFRVALPAAAAVAAS
jgi:hypothetical protein